MLHLVIVERKAFDRRPFQAVKREQLLLEARQPDFADVPDAIIQVVVFNAEFQVSSRDSPVIQEVINEVLQALPIRLHLLQNLTLFSSKRPELL